MYLCGDADAVTMWLTLMIQWNFEMGRRTLSASRLIIEAFGTWFFI